MQLHTHCCLQVITLEGGKAQAGLDCLAVFLDTLQLLTTARDKHRIPVEPAPPPPSPPAATAPVPAATPAPPPASPALQPAPSLRRGESIGLVALALLPALPAASQQPGSAAAAGTKPAEQPGSARPEQPRSATGEKQEAAEEVAADLQWRIAVRELLPRVLHLCYGPDWNTRLGGVAAMELLTEKCASGNCCTVTILLGFGQEHPVSPAGSAPATFRNVAAFCSF